MRKYIVDAEELSANDLITEDARRDKRNSMLFSALVILDSQLELTYSSILGGVKIGNQEMVPIFLIGFALYFLFMFALKLLNRIGITQIVYTDKNPESDYTSGLILNTPIGSELPTFYVELKDLIVLGKLFTASGYGGLYVLRATPGYFITLISRSSDSQSRPVVAYFDRSTRINTFLVKTVRRRLFSFLMLAEVLAPIALIITSAFWLGCSA